MGSNLNINPSLNGFIDVYTFLSFCVVESHMSVNYIFTLLHLYTHFVLSHIFYMATPLTFVFCIFIASSLTHKYFWYISTPEVHVFDLHVFLLIFQVENDKKK